jgi:hypothetical protein
MAQEVSYGPYVDLQNGKEVVRARLSVTPLEEALS